MNETLEILIENIQTIDIYMRNFLMSIGGDDQDYNSVLANGASKTTSYLGKNVTVAVPNIDYEPIKKIVKLMPGEVSKKVHINILTDSTRSSDSLKIFTIQLKPINLNTVTNLTQCAHVNPDFVNIVIEQSFDKSKHTIWV